jgi:hypothetical protein
MGAASGFPPQYKHGPQDVHGELDGPDPELENKICQEETSTPFHVCLRTVYFFESN